MITFRQHNPSDASAIKALFESVFTKSESESEGALIGNLAKAMITDTKSGDLYGFVALYEQEIVGVIFFSRLTFERDIEAFILAPVAVHTDYQGKGIGQKLISHGLRNLKDNGVNIVVTYGDPAFYSKVGFFQISQDVITPPFELTQPEGWLGQSLTGDVIEAIPGHCSCVKALDDPAYW